MIGYIEVINALEVPAPKGQVQVTLWVEPKEREALQALCKTKGTSVSSALRSWILTALQEQETELVVARSDRAPEASVTGGVAPEAIKTLMQRVAFLEEQVPKFHRDDLDEMHREVLSGEFGSLRYRMGIVEAQLQAQGGSIAWNSGPSEKADHNKD